MMLVGATSESFGNPLRVSVSDRADDDDVGEKPESTISCSFMVKLPDISKQIEDNTEAGAQSAGLKAGQTRLIKTEMFPRVARA